MPFHEGVYYPDTWVNIHWLAYLAEKGDTYAYRDQHHFNVQDHRFFGRMLQWPIFCRMRNYQIEFDDDSEWKTYQVNEGDAVSPKSLSWPSGQGSHLATHMHRRRLSENIDDIDEKRPLTQSCPPFAVLGSRGNATGSRHRPTPLRFAFSSLSTFRSSTQPESLLNPNLDSRWPSSGSSDFESGLATNQNSPDLALLEASPCSDDNPNFRHSEIPADRLATTLAQLPFVPPNTAYSLSEYGSPGSAFYSALRSPESSRGVSASPADMQTWQGFIPDPVFSPETPSNAYTLASLPRGSLASIAAILSRSVHDGLAGNSSGSSTRASTERTSTATGNGSVDLSSFPQPPSLSAMIGRAAAASKSKQLDDTGRDAFVYIREDDVNDQEQEERWILASQLFQCMDKAGVLRAPDGTILESFLEVDLFLKAHGLWQVDLSSNSLRSLELYQRDQCLLCGSRLP